MRTCRIVEWFAEPSVAPALLARAVDAAARQRCRLIRCDLLDDTLAPALFTHRGMRPVPSNNRILAAVLDPAIRDDDRRLQGWCLSGADSDFDLYEPR